VSPKNKKQTNKQEFMHTCYVGANVYIHTWSCLFWTRN